MLGTALRILSRELAPQPTGKARRQSRPPSAADPPPAPHGPEHAEPSTEPPLSAIESLTLQVLEEKKSKQVAMEDELAELSARRATRRQEAQLARDRIASGQAMPLPQDRAAAHSNLFSWKPPPPPSAAAPGREEDARLAGRAAVEQVLAPSEDASRPPEAGL
jgi:hypothetical protein